MYIVHVFRSLFQPLSKRPRVLDVQLVSPICGLKSHLYIMVSIPYIQSCQGQIYQHACYIHLWGPNVRQFSPTISMISCLFSENAPNDDPKWSWHVQGQKYQHHEHACYIHPLDLYFHPFHSMMSHFWVMPLFLEMCTEWRQNNLDIFQVKDTNMHATYTPESQTFVCFALW